MVMSDGCVGLGFLAEAGWVRVVRLNGPGPRIRPIGSDSGGTQSCGVWTDVGGYDLVVLILNPVCGLTFRWSCREP